MARARHLIGQLYLDRAQRRLSATGLGAFDAAGRNWTRGQAIVGETVGPHEAVRWLQRESGTPCRVPIAVIGPREADVGELAAAFALGAGLGELGLTLLCGGKGGVMEAACAGAAGAGGLSIGLLPDDDWTAANPFVAVPIATGIGVARNAIIARAALAVVAVGGGYGTLSEVAFALQFGRPVLGLADAPPVAGMRSCPTPDAALAAVCRIVLGLPAI